MVGVDVAGLWCPDHLSPHGGLGAHYSPRFLVRLATASELAERELVGKWLHQQQASADSVRWIH